MAALIEFVCVAKHESRLGPAITLEQRSWAYCAGGAGDGHQWVRIDPTAIEALRSRGGNGAIHLAAEKSEERSLTGGPAR